MGIVDIGITSEAVEHGVAGFRSGRLDRPTRRLHLDGNPSRRRCFKRGKLGFALLLSCLAVLVFAQGGLPDIQPRPKVTIDGVEGRWGTPLNAGTVTASTPAGCVTTVAYELQEQGRNFASGYAVNLEVDGQVIRVEQIPAGKPRRERVLAQVELPRGTHDLLLRVDPANAVREADEANNVQRLTYTIACAPPPRPYVTGTGKIRIDGESDPWGHGNVESMVLLQAQSIEARNGLCVYRIQFDIINPTQTPMTEPFDVLLDRGGGKAGFRQTVQPLGAGEKRTVKGTVSLLGGNVAHYLKLVVPKYPPPKPVMELYRVRGNCRG
jgi:hypothetical protein